MRPLCYVRFRRRRPGAVWTMSSTTSRPLSRLEALVIQDLRSRYRGEEIELIDLRWSH